MVTDILTDRAPKTTLDCASDRSSLRVATDRRCALSAWSVPVAAPASAPRSVPPGRGGCRWPAAGADRRRTGADSGRSRLLSGLRRPWTALRSGFAWLPGRRLRVRAVRPGRFSAWLAPLFRPAVRLVLQANAGFFWLGLASSGAVSRLGFTGILASLVEARQPPTAAITLLCDIGSVHKVIRLHFPDGGDGCFSVSDATQVSTSRLELLMGP